MIESALHALSLDPSALQQTKHPLRYLFTPDIGVLLLVVMAWKPIEAAGYLSAHASSEVRGIRTHK